MPEIIPRLVSDSHVRVFEIKDGEAVATASIHVPNMAHDEKRSFGEMVVAQGFAYIIKFNREALRRFMTHGESVDVFMNNSWMRRTESSRENDLVVFTVSFINHKHFDDYIQEGRLFFEDCFLDYLHILTKSLAGT